MNHVAPILSASAATGLAHRPRRHAVSDPDVARARRELRLIPEFAHWRGASFRRLGGLTNMTFLVEHKGEQICLRLPGVGTEEFIDRRSEAVTARTVAASGVTPPLLHLNTDTGVMVTRYMADATALTPALVRGRKGARHRVGRVLSQLHHLETPFATRLDPFAKSDEYLDFLRRKRVALPPGYREALGQMVTLRSALQLPPDQLAPCHNDTVCENFLDLETHALMIDWEYSGMNDPMWDLGDFSVEAALTPEEEAELFAGYFNGTPTAAERARFEINKAAYAFFGALWSLVQIATGNPTENYVAYGQERFDIAVRLLNAPDLPRQIRTIQSRR